MWKYKHSLINEYKSEVQKFGFRKRNTTSVENTIPDKNPKLKAKRQKKNPYKCELGKKKSRVRRLSAAEYCERTSGRRMIRLADFFRKDRKNLRCARCGKSTAWGCASCGVALCMVPRSSSANHSAVTCMDIPHIRWKYNIDTGAVMKSRGE